MHREFMRVSTSQRGGKKGRSMPATMSKLGGIARTSLALKGSDGKDFGPKGLDWRNSGVKGAIMCTTAREEEIEGGDLVTKQFSKRHSSYPTEPRLSLDFLLFLPHLGRLITLIIRLFSILPRVYFLKRAMRVRRWEEVMGITRL